MENENLGATQEVETTETEKTYTQAEVDEMIQKASDRRVSQALEKQARKNEAKVKEAEKLAQMNEAEKYEYQLQQRELAIAEKEKALALMENKNEASKILAEKGLSLALVDFVVAEDAETMSANISLLEKAFKASVKAEVEKRLGSNVPKQNLPLDKELDRTAFRKLSIMEQQKLANENPELYKQLTTD